jgi:signal transduction histidine kinase
VPDAALPEEVQLSHLLGGFTRARWLFVSCLGLTVVVAAAELRIQFPVAKTVGVAGAIFTYNILLSAYRRTRRPRVPALSASRVEAGLQIGLDLLALTALVHYSGGAQSPFACLYLIHAIAGGMLLSRRDAWRVAVCAFALFLGVVVLESQSALPHYHPTGVLEVPLAQRQQFELAASLAFLVTLISSVSITTWSMGGLRMREKQLVQAQQELVKKTEDLERAYGSLERQQKQLVQTEKQASLGRLVAGIAHEINNPIQFIHGNMVVLSEAFRDSLPLLDEVGASRPDLRIARLDYPFFRAQVPVLLKDMADGAARIRAIVRDLRTFARRDEGDLDETVDLTEAIRASVRLLHNQLKHFRAEEHLDPNLPKLRGNLTQLQQVVVNVLLNACQAMDPDADGVIRIRTRTEQGGQWVRLSIEDNGSGIRPEVRDHIFDPFFTTKQRTGGTGLGLAITDGIIQQHRGRIEVETEVGKGTTFHFLLPVRRNGAA